MKKNSCCSLFILPSGIIYLVFFIVPTVAGFYYCFTDWNIHRDTIHWIGFSNFIDIFSNKVVVSSIRNTLIFALVTTLGKNLLGLAMALIVDSISYFKNMFRCLFFFPAVLSYIVIGLIFTSILHPSGVFNSFLQSICIPSQISWLADKKVIMFTISAVEIWQWSGFHMAIYLAGLQGIPRELIECATLDGASGACRLVHIIIPMIVPAFTVNLVMALIGGIKVFDQVFVLTNGGPGYASEVISTQVYKLFGEGRWGYATALNLLLFLFTAVVALLIIAALRKKEVEV